MSLTNLERLRLQVADRRRLVLHEVVGIGDGISLGFQSRGAPVFEGSESVAIIYDTLTVVLQPGADYQFDFALGLLRLNVPADPGGRVQMSYQWAVFSDAELVDVLDQTGEDVSKSAIMVLRMVLADGDRFIKYTLGQEVVDRDAARKAIVDLLEELGDGQLGIVGVVLADSTYRKCLMFPYLEQNCDS